MLDIDFDICYEKLRVTCEKADFRGYDPFDGLNSTFFQALPGIRNSRACRLAWVQFFKQNIINLRPLLGVRKDYNPKGLGLFLSAYCNLYKLEPENEYLNVIKFLINKIKICQSTGYSGICWGYNFDWQARAFFQPKGTPSVVVSSYVAGALLDAYEIIKDENLLNTARSTCDFILNDLNRTYDEDGDFAFSYCPVDHTQVFNASLLGVRLLSRVYGYTKEPVLIEESRKAISFVCKHQNRDGSWLYSPLPYHQWVDSFHTGYNLESIYTYQEVSGDKNYSESFELGLTYYLNTFFEKNGRPKYYNNSIYPIDLHTTAQLIVTLSKINKIFDHQELVEKVLSWSQNNMFDEKQSYFYYQKNRFLTIKINYIRWTQAWMMLGYSHYFLNFKKDR